jgi:hypothetical protein
MPVPGCTWRSAVSTMCQCVLILSANVFLAIRFVAVYRRSLLG